MSKRIAHVSLEDSYLEIKWFPSHDLFGIARISEMEENGQLNQVNEGKVFTIRSTNGESLSGYAYDKFRLTLSGIDETVVADKTVTKSVFDAVLKIVKEFDGKPIDREIDIPIYSDKVKGGKRKTQRRKHQN